MIGNEQDLVRLTKHELLKIATDLDVKYRTRMGKPELIDSILDVLQIKKKDLDPVAESILSEQTKVYQEHQQEDSSKHTMEASKYQLTNLEKEKTKEEHTQTAAFAPHFVPIGANLLHDDDWIPSGYGDNIITVMVIDPTHIYAYFEVQDARRYELLSSAGYSGHYETVVRLYDVTDVSFNGHNSWSTQEINVGFSPSWYFNVAANRSYCAEIGLKLSNDQFLVIARSNVINTPRESVSDFYDEEWMMIDFNRHRDLYNELYRLSGGYMITRNQLNSAFITEMNKQEITYTVPITSLSSETLSSQFKVLGEDEFWLWVDTELIVYGQVKPDAKELLINNEKIKFDKDGRFRMHMALPNGNYPFHVKGVSKSGKLTKEVKPVINRSLDIDTGVKVLEGQQSW